MKITFPQPHTAVAEGFTGTDSEKDALWYFLNTTYTEQYYVEATSDGVTFSDHYDAARRSFSVAVQPAMADDAEPSEESTFNTHDVTEILKRSAVHYKDEAWLYRNLHGRLDGGVVIHNSDDSMSIVGHTFAQMTRDGGPANLNRPN